MIDDFKGDKPVKLWMCCNCGEIVGRYKRVNINHCKYDRANHVWIKPDGCIVLEYA